MFSETFKNLIRYRLAIIKYTLCASTYWDIPFNRCVLDHAVSYRNWMICYHGGIATIPLLVGYLYTQHTAQNDIFDVETNAKDLADSKNYKNLSITLMFAETATVTFCLLLVSILKQMRVAICAFYNGCFQLDCRLKGKIKKTRQFMTPFPIPFLQFILI